MKALLKLLLKSDFAIDTILEFIEKAINSVKDKNAKGFLLLLLPILRSVLPDLIRGNEIVAAEALKGNVDWAKMLIDQINDLETK